MTTPSTPISAPTPVRLDSLPVGAAFRHQGSLSGAIRYVGPRDEAGFIQVGCTAISGDALVRPLSAAETAALLTGADANFQAACKAVRDAYSIFEAAQTAEDTTWDANQEAPTSQTFLAHLAALDQGLVLRADYYRAIADKHQANRALFIAQRAASVAQALEAAK